MVPDPELIEERVRDLKQELGSLRIERDRPPARPWRWIVLFSLLVGGVAAAYYFGRVKPAMAGTEVETLRPTVMSAGGGTSAAPLLTASGYVVARRKAVVSAKIQGRLAELRVEEGSRVREGEIIARLESAEYEANVERARAQIARMQADLAEYRRQARIAAGLAEQGVGSRDQAEAAESRVRIGEATLAQARADLVLQQSLYDNTLIKAPFSGVVVKKMAEVGESVAPIPPGVNISTSSGAIVALADLATLEVEADVNEANVAKLKAKQPAEVMVQAFPDKRYRAVLRQIIPSADRTKATVQTKVTILDKDGEIRPEMSATVTFLEIETSAPKRSSAAVPMITVPKEAIVHRDGKSFVFEVQERKVRQRTVTLGVERQGQVVVRDGLLGSETLVARPPAELRDGDQVRLKSS